MVSNSDLIPVTLVAEGDNVWDRGDARYLGTVRDVEYDFDRIQLNFVDGKSVVVGSDAMMYVTNLDHKVGD